MKHARELFWHYWLPLLTMLALIDMESTDTFSGRHTGNYLRTVLLWLGVHLRPRELNMANLVLRKGGHMVGYGLLCLCFLALLRGAYWLQHEYKMSLRGTIQIRRMWLRPVWAALALFFTFLVAAADELHQMQIPSRDGSWRDVALDTTAASILLLLIWAKTSWRCRKTQAAPSAR